MSDPLAYLTKNYPDFTSRKMTLAIAPILAGTAKIVVVFSRNFKSRIRVVAKQFKGRMRGIDMVVTIDRPNYREREYLKKCKSSGSKPSHRLIVK